MGNLIAHKKGSGKKVMLCAHMDEEGIIATFIDDCGFIRFDTVGKLNPESLIMRSMTFLNGTSGVVGYDASKKLSDLKISDMYIDIGEDTGDSAGRKVKVGDMAVFSSNSFHNGNKIFSKAIDGRIGCYILLDVIKEVLSPNDLYFVFCVQNEVGLRGAGAAVNSIQPDYAISVDAAQSFDTPKGKDITIKTGNGAAIMIKDSKVITDTVLRSRLVDVAVKEKIAYQMEISKGGDSDIGSIGVACGGVPCAAVSVPCRYMHSALQSADLRDVQSAIKLLLAALKDEL